MKDKKTEGRKALKQSGAARKKGAGFTRAERLNKARWAQEKVNRAAARARERCEDNDRRDRALTAIGKPGKKIGKPFQVGEDPRRHTLGRVSLDRAAFAAKLNNLLCNGVGDPEALARVLWRYAMAGQAWAVTELLDRICGKVAQSIQIEKPVIRGIVVCHQDEEVTPADLARLDTKIKEETGDDFALSPPDELAKRALALSRKTGDPDGR